MGWVEAQCLAHERWAQTRVPTCEGVTYRDFVFLSPEAAAAACQAVRVTSDYQEHAAVCAGLAFEALQAVSQTWPLPGEINWNEVDVEADSTSWYAHFAQNFDRSLNGHVMGVPGRQLPRHCYGRAKRLHPQRHNV